jgi:threonine dehydrogenase-like Zn-dependent dehydrogenase
LESLAVKSVALIGPGRLGLLIAKVLALAGHQILVLGRSAPSLVLPRQWGLRTALVDEVAENSFGCVVDASGHVGGFRQALRILAPRGVLILKSTFASLEPLDLSKVVVGELRIMGSRCGPFADALQLLKRQQVPVADLIDARYPLSAGLAAFERAGQPGIRKILLQP